MYRCVEYVDAQGRSRFGRWFDSLTPVVAARVQRAIERMAQGNFADSKPVGKGVSECRLHTGPGYRIYFGRSGDELVILLAGGTKRGQSRDIA